MEDYKKLIDECDEWVYKIDNFIGADDLANHIYMCADAIAHLVEEYKILEWQNHLERCEHQHTKDNRDEIAKERDAMLADLKEYASCDYCKYSNSECDEYWAIGEMGLSGLCNGEHFEWRGVQE